MTENEIAAGQTVTFRSDFSAELVGIVFEIVVSPSGTLYRTAHDSQDGGYAFCTIRTRVGKSRRWGYRLAKLSDLLPA
jgi:hypothetical protein